MTARELLQREHPECVDDDFVGGCEGCPTKYGYLSFPKEPCDATEECCAACWNREVTIYVKDTLGPDDVIEPADKTVYEMFEEYVKEKKMTKEYTSEELKVNEPTCDLDYKAGYARLKDEVEKQKKDVQEYQATIVAMQETINRQHHKIDKYEAIIRCVEAFVGNKIL